MMICVISHLSFQIFFDFGARCSFHVGQRAGFGSPRGPGDRKADRTEGGGVTAAALGEPW